MQLVLVQPHLEYAPDANNSRIIRELCEPLLDVPRTPRAQSVYYPINTIT